MDDNNVVVPWYDKKIENIVTAFRSSLGRGLSYDTVLQLQKSSPKNVIDESGTPTIIKMILRQLLSPLSLILLITLFVVFFLHSTYDMFVIAIALSINIIAGVLQEYKSANVFKKLSGSLQYSTTVLRDGVKKALQVQDILPGDIVYVFDGDKIPADMRLIEVNDLEIDESILTGEWKAVEKSVHVLRDSELPLQKQKNMLFMGTIVQRGSATGIVVATGESTALGIIAQQTRRHSSTESPLQVAISHLANNIMIFIAVTVVIIFALGLLRSQPIIQMILLAISVGVAAMPEGLPAAVSVVLASAMNNIMKKGALVKNLLSAETLGATTIIFTDKTGTLTNGVMEVDGVYISPDNVTEKSMASVSTRIKPKDADGDAYELLKMATLATDAFIDSYTEDDKPIICGHPLEKAIVDASYRAGILRDDLLNSGYERIASSPFNSKRRFAISLNEYNEKKRMCFVGMPERLIEYATHHIVNGKKYRMTKKMRAYFKRLQNRLGADGKGVIAVAYRNTGENIIPEDVEEPSVNERLGFVFVGILSFSDTVRDDAAETIKNLHDAGVTVVMVTGDQSETAKVVAHKVGLPTQSIISGEDLDDLSDEAVMVAVHEQAVFARVLPEQKLRILLIMKEYGEIVAMTGDGVNDAPALAAAHIGIAQNSGSDVAKVAADMILTNGSLSVIRDAIFEGRRAFANMRKIILYLLSTSASEIVLIVGSIFVGLPTPLLSTQILWANIIEEGLMSFPLAFDPAERNVMGHSPQKYSSHSLLDAGLYKFMGLLSLFTGLTLFVLYYFLVYSGVGMDEIRTIMFIAISIDTIFLTFSFKNVYVPVWKVDFFTNKYLLIALGLSLFLLVASVLLAPIRKLLSLVLIDWWMVVFLVAFGFIILIETEILKYYVLYRRRKKS